MRNNREKRSAEEVIGVIEGQEPQVESVDVSASEIPETPDVAPTEEVDEDAIETIKTSVLEDEQGIEQEIEEVAKQLDQVLVEYNVWDRALEALVERENNRFILFRKIDRYWISRKDPDFVHGIVHERPGKKHWAFKEVMIEVKSLVEIKKKIGQLQVAIHHMKQRITPKDRVYLKTKGIELPA